MNEPEIPLLRESTTFSARLVAAANQFGESRYRFHRRVNWSYRYSHRFYAREAECFRKAPGAYLAGNPPHPPDLDDVWDKKLRPRQVLIVLTKVLAHRLFHLVGGRVDRRLKAESMRTYRKCYVDDIEMVFDPAQASVIRAVYPFPINVRRQLRYFAFLRRERLDFKLAGNPYLAGDVFRFIARRDIRSLMHLESRAQILHAKQVAALGVQAVELSDEFDIGSLDFSRRLARYPIRLINSAHGVGKYLPVHAYPNFHVLTARQQQYYHATRDCEYLLRRLNDRMPIESPKAGSAQRPLPDRGVVSVVFLSQTFSGLSHVIADNESTAIARLRDEFKESEGVKLIYKPHPNSKKKEVPAGFQRLSDLADVNGGDGTLFVSFFSTCQIDPAFKGKKVLLRGDLIHPEIAFDDSETILDIEGLIKFIDGARLLAGQL